MKNNVKFYLRIVLVILASFPASLFTLLLFGALFDGFLDGLGTSIFSVFFTLGLYIWAFSIISNSKGAYYASFLVTIVWIGAILYENSTKFPPTITVPVILIYCFGLIAFKTAINKSSNR